MTINLFLLVFSFSLFALPASFSMETKSSGHMSGHIQQTSIHGITPKTIPPKYSLENLRKDSWAMDLSFIKKKYPISLATEQEWSTKSLLANKCFIYHGIDFLNFDIDRVLTEYSYAFDKPSKLVSGEKAYFGSLWDRGVLSTSLVCEEAPFAAGNYGLILEVPPQLIIRTYTSDAVTTGGSNLQQYSNNAEGLNNYLDKYVLNSYAGIKPHPYDKQSALPLIPVSELRNITQKNASYNEVFIAPRGMVDGKLFEMKIIGFFIDDQAMQTEFSIPPQWPKDQPFPGQPKYTNADKVRMLKEIASEFKIPIIEKSTLGKDIGLLQSGDLTIHPKREGKNIAISIKSNPSSDTNYGAMVKKHRESLNEIQQLEVFIQHPGAHPLPGKSLSSNDEDIHLAKTHYESRLKDAKQNLQKDLGSSMSVDSLLEQKKLLDEIQQLEVFIQHPQGKAMSEQTAEDIQQTKAHYKNRLGELKKKLQ